MNIDDKEEINKKYFSNLNNRERAIFEGAISMGALFHQFVGTPISKNTAPSLEKAIKQSLELQPATDTVEVKIDLSILENNNTEFEYTALTGDMLDVKITTKVQDTQVTVRLKFIEELNYPLMYVE